MTQPLLSYSELKKQNEALKKENERLKLDLVKNTNERKRAEIKTEKAHSEIKQFKFALDNLDTYVYIKNTKSQYLYANKKTLKLFNCTIEDLSNLNDSNFFPPKTYKQLLEIERDILEHGHSTSNQVESTDNSGNRVVYWDIKTPIFDKKDPSKIESICGISTDITERIKVEETLKATALQLKELNTTKDKLFSVLAHDLRGPFYHMIGVSELLLNNNTDETETETFIKIINSSAKNTLNLLDNLLSWAQSQTGELRIKLEKISLSQLIFDTLEFQKAPASAKNISLAWNPIENYSILTDQNIFKTILRNLISNAVKFTNSGGQITITTTMNQNELQVTVTDNGVGMNKTRIQSLFNLSTNTTARGTNKEQGSGLGLILCQDLINKLNGKIWAESQEAKGSSFKFTIPVNAS
ncbi:ATP-binding protein [Algibacter miyuki]|uniref:histidine kinase n=1 Tax=Algibacter miyuki TaxID=1306933 RepID=A0ABV5GYS6_9FLAO|nr:PAS domain-containing sensor histidine kinase [Algibacter miyuki]MDN3667002.1 PAS domain-containing sensor histidine kinase [Algibacter miyuki]